MNTSFACLSPSLSIYLYLFLCHFFCSVAILFSLPWRHVTNHSIYWQYQVELQRASMIHEPKLRFSDYNTLLMHKWFGNEWIWTVRHFGKLHKHRETYRWYWNVISINERDGCGGDGGGGGGVAVAAGMSIAMNMSAFCIWSIRIIDFHPQSFDISCPL